MKKIKLLIGTIFVLGICCWSSCQKDKITSCEGSIGVFIQVEDCGGLVFELEDGTRLEDTGFRLWAVKANGRTTYSVEFAEVPITMTTCSGGRLVEFLKVNEL